MMSRTMAILAVAAVLGLAGCTKTLEAPTDPGVCWHLVSMPGGKVKFNRLAVGQSDLEHCAAELEKMRISFAALGASQDRITGAYQGQFLFIQPEGVFTSQTYSGYHYPFMVRTGDGRLAVPGAMPQSPQ